MQLGPTNATVPRAYDDLKMALAPEKSNFSWWAAFGRLSQIDNAFEYFLFQFNT